MIFKNIENKDIEIAYSIIEDRYYELVSKGINQYPYPFPKKNDYIEQQKKNLNFGLYDNNILIGLLGFHLYI